MTAADPEPPVLVSYVEPWPAAASNDTTRVVNLSVELLVNADGAVGDVRVDDCDSIGCDALVDLAFAAAHWSFAPATLGDGTVSARILFPMLWCEAPAEAGASQDSHEASESEGEGT